MFWMTFDPDWLFVALISLGASCSLAAIWWFCQAAPTAETAESEEVLRQHLIVLGYPVSAERIARWNNDDYDRAAKWVKDELEAARKGMRGRQTEPPTCVTGRKEHAL
jgi:hypothetical protein